MKIIVTQWGVTIEAAQPSIVHVKRAILLSYSFLLKKKGAIPMLKNLIYYSSIVISDCAIIHYLDEFFG